MVFGGQDGCMRLDGLFRRPSEESSRVIPPDPKHPILDWTFTNATLPDKTIEPTAIP